MPGDRWVQGSRHNRCSPPRHPDKAHVTWGAVVETVTTDCQHELPPPAGSRMTQPPHLAHVPLVFVVFKQVNL